MIDIDQKVRAQFTEDIYNKALEIFVQSNEPIVQELKSANTERLGRIFHKLKGGAGMLGLTSITKALDVAEHDMDGKGNLDSIIGEFNAIKVFSEQ